MKLKVGEVYRGTFAGESRSLRITGIALSQAGNGRITFTVLGSSNDFVLWPRWPRWLYPLVEDLSIVESAWSFVDRIEQAQKIDSQPKPIFREVSEVDLEVTQ